MFRTLYFFLALGRARNAAFAATAARISSLNAASSSRLTFADVDGPAGIALEARVEELVRIGQRRALGRR